MQASWCAARVMRHASHMQHHTSHIMHYHATLMRHASGNIQLTYIIQWHATSYIAAATAAAAAATTTTTTTTTTSGHNATRASRMSSPCRREMLRHKQSPAQRLAVIQTAERPNISSYTSRFIVTIDNRLYFKDNVTWMYINCVLRLLKVESCKI